MGVSDDEIYRIAEQIRRALRYTPIGDPAEGILSPMSELPSDDEQRIEDALVILDLLGEARK